MASPARFVPRPMMYGSSTRKTKVMIRWCGLTSPFSVMKKKRGNEGCRGAPDLVIEILSPSNTGEEYVRKFNLYLEAGVREYWVVAPKSKTVQVFDLQNGAYIGTVYHSGAALSSKVLEGLTVTLDGLFAG